jgi:hypothetical protein
LRLKSVRHSGTGQTLGDGCVGPTQTKSLNLADEYPRAAPCTHVSNG